MSPRAAARLESFGFSRVFDYAAGKSDWFASGLPGEGDKAGVTVVGDVTETDVPTFAPSDSVETVKERLAGTGWQVAVILNDQGTVLGTVEASAGIDPVDPTVKLEDVMQLGPITFRFDAPLEQVSKYLDRNQIDEVLVTSPQGTLLGISQKSAVDEALIQPA